MVVSRTQHALVARSKAVAVPVCRPHERVGAFLSSLSASRQRITVGATSIAGDARRTPTQNWGCGQTNRADTHTPTKYQTLSLSFSLTISLSHPISYSLSLSSPQAAGAVCPLQITNQPINQSINHPRHHHPSMASLTSALVARPRDDISSADRSSVARSPSRGLICPTAQ